MHSERKEGLKDSEKFSDKIAIVSLLCLVTKKMREKNIGVSVKDVVEKIINARATIVKIKHTLLFRYLVLTPTMSSA